MFQSDESQWKMWTIKDLISQRAVENQSEKNISKS